MQFLTDFADQAVILPLVFVVAAMLAAQGWRRGAMAWLVVIAGTFALMLALKLMCLACSPVFGLAHIRSPSGHVAAGTVVAGGLAGLILGRASVVPVAVLAVLVVGLTRLVLGAHSLPEVAMGGLIGVIGATLLQALAGPKPPGLRFGRLGAAAVLVALLFHGLHLPAEAAIRRGALRVAQFIPACRDTPAEAAINVPPTL